VSKKIKAQRKVNDTQIFVDEVETQLREKPLRGSQHERFPTRFSYLKGSSMELHTLEPTSKIDFGLQHNTLVKRLQRD
jgi:hypothetical protein